MVEEYLLFLAMILLLGTLVSALAYKLKISNVLFLVFSGMVLGSFGIINFPHNTIILISTLAMIIVIFDSTVRLKFKDVEKFSSYSMRLVLGFYFACVFFLTFAVFLLFDISADPYQSLVLSLIFSSLMFGIDHGLNIEQLKVSANNKIIKLLEIESLLNRPLTIIAPLILLHYLAAVANGSNVSFITEIVIFLKQLFFSVLFGGVLGFVVYVILNTKLKENLSYLVALTGSVLTFILAEMFSFSGVISLTVFALIFGNFHIRHKLELEKFTSLFGYIFNIFVFILIGSVLLVDFDYIVRGTIIFIFYILLRFITVNLSLIGAGFTLKNKIFMTLNVTKGIDVAIIILIMLSQYQVISGMKTILNLSLLFSLYCFVVSTCVALFYKPLLKK
ncbi:MAG: cation:proton antiporter [Nanoarchaeota archaeon]|nr:cation:proton antiporter [Nanoarchaeota archaeon]